MRRHFKTTLIISFVLFFLQQALVFSAPAENVEILQSEKYFKKVRSLVDSASKSIFVAMYIFRNYSEHPFSPSNLLTQSLIKAKQRGVDVKVLLDISDWEEENSKENKKTGKLLAENGIKVYYDSAETLMHTKTIVIDSRYVITGSHNWSYHGLTKNNELSVLIDSPDLAKEVQEYIIGIINNKN